MSFFFFNDAIMGTWLDCGPLCHMCCMTPGDSVAMLTEPVALYSNQHSPVVVIAGARSVASVRQVSFISCWFTPPAGHQLAGTAMGPHPFTEQAPCEPASCCTE